MGSGSEVADDLWAHIKDPDPGGKPKGGDRGVSHDCDTMYETTVGAVSGVFEETR